MTVAPADLVAQLAELRPAFEALTRALARLAQSMFRAFEALARATQSVFARIPDAAAPPRMGQPRRAPTFRPEAPMRGGAARPWPVALRAYARR